MTLSVLHSDPSGLPAEREKPATPADFGDVRAEFAALLSGCGVYDLSNRALLAVSGADRVRWLNGMITNKVRDLAAGQGVYAFVLNPQGHILGDLYAYNRGESFLLETERAQLPKLLELFRRYIIMDKVEITDLSDKIAAVGMAGPKSRETLGAAGLDVHELQPLEMKGLKWREHDASLLRGDSEKHESYEVLLAPEAAAKFSSALQQNGATPVGTAALELYRIALGVPRYAVDIRERELPAETGQMRALHFSKGCYIGQEIVERIRSRGNVHRMFTGFLVEGPLPAPETKVQADGKDVGEITTSASLPLAGGARPVALGYIRREAAASSTNLQAGEAKVVVAETPFAGVW